MKQKVNEYGSLARFYDWRMEEDEEDIPFYVDLSVKSGGPVLELGCGTGRLEFSIAEAGVDIVGLEISTSMLDIARRKLSESSSEVREKVFLFQGDMANFSINKSFSLIILPNNQFRELLTREEQLSCLRCILEHLEDKGSLVIEITNPFRLISRCTVDKVFHRKVGYCQKTGSVVECLFKITGRNLIEQWVECETTYIEHFSNGKTVRHTEYGRMRYIFPAELDLLLEISGFEVVEKWGGYDFSKLEKDSSRLIIQAIKEDKTRV